MHVLIADNSQLYPKLLSNILLKYSIPFVITHTAEETLRYVELQKFSFICLAQEFSDGQGINLAKKIREQEQYQALPIVLLTSDIRTDTVTDALKSGITDVFHKQDINQLLQFIKRLAEQQQPIKASVLMVEDSVSQRELLKMMLQSYGLTVDAFESADIAYEAFRQHSYDLVITDIILHESLSGVSFISKIRRIDDKKGDVPILAMTAYDNESRRIELFTMGINDYIIKPIREIELMARVRNLIRTK